METPTPLPPESCGTCVFFLREDETSGECRRYPPSVPYMIESDGSPRQLVFASTPDVEDDQWCGEYRRPGILVPPPTLPVIE